MVLGGWGGPDQVASTYFNLKSLKRKTKGTPIQETVRTGDGVGCLEWVRCSISVVS